MIAQAQDTLRLPAASAATHSPELTQMHTLLRRLPWPHGGGRQAIRTLGVTSCYRGEGVSTIATQLARAAAASGNFRILLVDANVEHSAMDRLFDLAPSPGLAEAILDGRSLIDCVQPTGVKNLAVLQAGNSDTHTAALSAATGLAGVTRVLKEAYDLVVFDLPAALSSSFAITLAPHLDGVCLVVESERVRSEVAAKARNLLASAGANLLGVVLNKQPQHVPDWLYKTL